jgi:hypothetical protein
METLSQSVYECTLPVEAHMICDLLARAGIAARVDGEFLAGAGGDLPLGSSVRVRVAPSRAMEAREVIDEWQRLQPPDPIPIPPDRSSWRSPLWFFCGAMLGGSLMLLTLRTPANQDSVDFDDDGRPDETYYYAGKTLVRIESDRNADGKIDARWINDYRGLLKRYESDDDFDGRFEWQTEVENGLRVRSVLDADGDGKPERVVLFRHGVPLSMDIYDPQSHRVAVREDYENSRLVAREYDQDGDGTFERRVEYDAMGEPVHSDP